MTRMCPSTTTAGTSVGSTSNGPAPQNPPAMARSHTRAARSAAALVVAVVLVAAGVAACGGGPPSVAPTAAPTPLVTPNPHLPSPATAQQVFAGLDKAGLRITANTATLGVEGSDIVTKIYATYLGWPLDVVQFRSSDALTRAESWEAGESPGRGEPPVTLAGSNILIVWGPTISGAAPTKPDARQSDGLKELVAALDVLLSPLKARTNVPVTVSAPSASAPGASALGASAPSSSASTAP